MAQRIEIKPRVQPEQPELFPKTATLFDWLEYAIERTERLIMKAKYLLFGLAFLLFLIYEFADFGRYKLEKWNKESHTKSAIAGAVETTNENTAK